MILDPVPFFFRWSQLRFGQMIFQMSSESDLWVSSWERSLSLPRALESIVREAGYTIDHDDLLAALGLSVLLGAPLEEAELVDWPLFARDAFLPQVAFLFGVEIRDVHPPEAALGLDRAVEFEQHFDASYRPLIQNALRNGQPVLAWRGWPGEAGLLWGIVREPCNEGIGFRGETVQEAGSEITKAERVLQTPPLQVYVVERIVPATPDAETLVSCALHHAARVLDNSIGKRFGVITGPPAYGVLLDRIKAVREEETAKLARGVSALANVIVNGHGSAIRFFDWHQGTVTERTRKTAASLVASCRQVVAALIGLTDESDLYERLRNPKGVSWIESRIQEAMAATTAASGVRGSNGKQIQPL